MATFYDFDRANARLPELRDTLLSLRSLRAEVIEMRDRIVQLAGALSATGEAGQQPGGIDDTEAERAARLLHLRMQAIVDQMEAAVTRISEWGIELRDVQSGLVDFPALVAGRQVWLCWRLGEETVAWWHEMSEGFESRRRLEDLF